jgi:hypothetical protein
MTDDELVDGYLKRLGRHLPRTRRRELLDEIAVHIAEARAAGVPVRDVLDGLGDPAAVAAMAGARHNAGRLGALELIAIIVLLVGGVFGFVLSFPGMVAGWAVGVVLLGVSPRWRWPDKLLGTLVWPGGLAAPLLLLIIPVSTQVCSGSSGSSHVTCTGGSPIPPWLGISLFVIGVAAPVGVAIRLAKRARPTTTDAEPLLPAAATW